MQVVAYTTDKITVNSHTLEAVLVAAIPALAERTIVAITSKVAALCEGRAVPIDGTDKDTLIAREAQRYLPRSRSRYNVSFTITHDMLVPTAGIDESNGNGSYVLWPKDPQTTANRARAFLCAHFGVQDVGVILTDSALRPMRWGVTGMAIAASGFTPVRDAIGEPDLFGRELRFTKESMQDGLASAAALVMGEGNQQTPIAVITDVPFVTFTRRDPTPEELQALVIDPADDIYAPFLTAVDWQTGGQA
jgi:dihydrofolate synthase / folylpolyglutamate synthase